MSNKTMSTREFLSMIAEAQDRKAIRAEIDERVKNGDLRVEPGVSYVGGSRHHFEVREDYSGVKVLQTSMPMVMFLLDARTELVVTRSGVFSRWPGNYNDANWKSMVWDDHIGDTFGYMGLYTDACPDDKWRLLAIMSFLCAMTPSRAESSVIHELLVSHSPAYTDFLVRAWNAVLTKRKPITATDVENVYDMIKTGNPSFDAHAAYTASIMNGKNNEWIADVVVDADKIVMVSDTCPSGCYVRFPEGVDNQCKAILFSFTLDILQCFCGVYNRHGSFYAQENSGVYTARYPVVSSWGEVSDGVMKLFGADDSFLTWDEEVDPYYTIE